MVTSVFTAQSFPCTNRGTLVAHSQLTTMRSKVSLRSSVIAPGGQILDQPIGSVCQFISCSASQSCQWESMCSDRTVGMTCNSTAYCWFSPCDKPGLPAPADCHGLQSSTIWYTLAGSSSALPHYPAVKALPRPALSFLLLCWPALAEPLWRFRLS